MLIYSQTECTHSDINQVRLRNRHVIAGKVRGFAVGFLANVKDLCDRPMVNSETQNLLL